MVKKELVGFVASRMAVTTEVATAAVEAVIDGIRCGVNGAEKRVDLRGFGSFVVVEKAERTGRNPRTGEPVVIPAKKAVRFKPNSQLLDSDE